jgi:anti-sigma-K factor RskA
MTIGCDDANEMLAAFAMNRLDRADQATVTHHLSDCRQHDAELVELRAMVGALPATVEEQNPPERLRRSLLQAFDRATSVTARVSGHGAGSRSGLFGWLGRAPRPAYGLAAALAIAVIGLAAWNLSLRSASDAVTVRSIAEDGMSLRVVYLKDQQIAVLDVKMPSLGGNKAYQAWKIDNAGTPSSLGLVAESGSFAFHADLSDARAIAISVEPPGGSAQPTTAPVLVEEL